MFVLMAGRCYNCLMEKPGTIYNWPLVGNRQITEFLENSIKKSNISGTYIFNGPDNLGKTTLAKSFAQVLLCQGAESTCLPCGTCQSCRQFSGSKKETDREECESGESHGDLHIIKKEKDKKNISAEQVREFIRKLSLSSFLGGYKIGIIKHADSLSEGAANALLKTLEEPRRKVVIILVAEDMESLPATIASRSRILQFLPVSDDAIYEYLLAGHQVSRSKAKDLSRLSLGRPALALKFLQDKDFSAYYHEQVQTFLDFKAQSIGERFSAIEKLFGKKNSGQEAAGIAARILQAWQGALRDLLLMEYGFYNMIQHQIFREKLSALQSAFPLADISRLLCAIDEARENIFANVNPKLALEEVAVQVR